MVSKENEVFFVTSIIRWYVKYKRKFPWRLEKEPYKILIAEIMLQRTKANQVLPVYLDFLKRYPNIASISNSEIENIYSCIGSLGLNRRSISISNMANYIIKYHDGLIPNDSADLKKLPGVGQYVSDAMGVFAFNKKITVIDSNVIRIVTRFFGISTIVEIRKNKDFIKFCQELLFHVPDRLVKEFNWGMLDLGAIICVMTPKCGMCPLSENCNYFKEQNIKSSSRNLD